MKTLLLLEDNAERIAGFEAVVKDLGEDWRLQVWCDAPTMLLECDGCFEHTALISLDHDLNPQPDATVDLLRMGNLGYGVELFSRTLSQ